MENEKTIKISEENKAVFANIILGLESDNLNEACIYGEAIHIAYTDTDETHIDKLDRELFNAVMEYANTATRNTGKTRRKLFNVYPALDDDNNLIMVVEPASKRASAEPTNKPFASLLKLAKGSANGKRIELSGGDWYVQKTGNNALTLFSTRTEEVTLKDGSTAKAQITAKHDTYTYNDAESLIKLTEYMRSLANDNKLSSWKLRA